MKTVLITGGTGLIGNALAKELTRKGYAVIILTRQKNEKNKAKNISYAGWDIEKQIIDKEAIAKADHIIHLAGANVAEKRWNDKRKKQIVDSRVKSGALLVKVIKEVPNTIQTVVSASAIGWYGPDPQIPNPHPFVETDKPAGDFLGITCQQWEGAIAPVTELGKRLVILRTGIVLSREGGAYPEFEKPLQFGVAAVLGTGKQVISWIHINDLVRMYVEAIENNSMSGVYNAVAPHPVNNEALVAGIAQYQKFHITAPVPSFILKTVLGEMSVEVLKSTTVSSKKIEDTGFRFLFPDIGTAIYNLKEKASG